MLGSISESYQAQRPGSCKGSWPFTCRSPTSLQKLIKHGHSPHARCRMGSKEPTQIQSNVEWLVETCPRSWWIILICLETAASTESKWKLRRPEAKIQDNCSSNPERISIKSSMSEQGPCPCRLRKCFERFVRGNADLGQCIGWYFSSGVT